MQSVCPVEINSMKESTTLKQQLVAQCTKQNVVKLHERGSKTKFSILFLNKLQRPVSEYCEERAGYPGLNLGTNYETKNSNFLQLFVEEQEHS